MLQGSNIVRESCRITYLHYIIKAISIHIFKLLAIDS